MTTKSIGVMIVDDEAIIRKGLIATIPWSRYGMQVTADAPNGKRAWDAFLAERPEVVITDIVMPELNGIELAKRIKEEAPATKILLLSCHTDFEYVQQGIKLGASGYVLKTSYNDDELEEFLHKFQVEIGEERKRGKDEIRKRFREWLFGIHKGLTDCLSIACEWPWIREPNTIYLAVNASEGAGGYLEQIASESDYEWVKVGEERYFLFTPKSASEWMEKKLIDLKVRYPELRWLKDGTAKGVDSWLDAVKRIYRQTEIEHTFNVNPKPWPEPIAQAVKMLMERVDEKLSVTDVARAVGLSRSHLSCLFKKTLGEGFVAYTYRMKLKAAQELLQTTDTAIQDIAASLGMVDSKYFSKWFKRCTGTPPSEYRQRHKSSQ